MQEFLRYQLCEPWQVDPIAVAAYEYHDRCEAFEKRTCTAERDGQPYPANPEQRRMINRYVDDLRREIANRECAAMRAADADRWFAAFRRAILSESRRRRRAK